jgi:hypothetical protein
MAAASEPLQPAPTPLVRPALPLPPVTSAPLPPPRNTEGENRKFEPLPPALTPAPAVAPPISATPRPAVSPNEAVPDGSFSSSSTPWCADFSPDPVYEDWGFDPQQATEPYETKSPVVGQRPWVEWGRPFYAPGLYPESETWLGRTNPVAQQLLVYGDYRAALATRDSGAVENNQLANRLNLEIDWKITSTGRFHTSLQPLNRQASFTRVEFNSNEADFIQAFNANPVTGFLEADLGALWGGFTGHVLPFEMPIAVGAMPLLFQNGVWLDDNVIGAAITLPARNSAPLDIPNYDITFFYLFDNITSPAFEGDASAAKAYGVATFLDMLGGYVELDYAYLEDRATLDRSYHNLGIGYTRRYFRWLSNSVRVIANLGQDVECNCNTADGVLLLVENSLVTENPYLFVPYFNFFAGFRRPQSVARNAAAGGVLRNTGILFESDNLTGYPTLDASGHEAWGGALGVNVIPATIDHQLVLEYAFVQVMDDVAFRQAAGPQHGIGVRYQKNLSNSWLLRADAMAGWLSNADDLTGVRLELRHKF